MSHIYDFFQQCTYIDGIPTYRIGKVDENDDVVISDEDMIEDDTQIESISLEITFRILLRETTISRYKNQIGPFSRIAERVGCAVHEGTEGTNGFLDIRGTPNAVVKFNEIIIHHLLSFIVDRDMLICFSLIPSVSLILIPYSVNHTRETQISFLVPEFYI
jgi:hypothetical protein